MKYVKVMTVVTLLLFISAVASVAQHDTLRYQPGSADNLPQMSQKVNTVIKSLNTGYLVYLSDSLLAHRTRLTRDIDSLSAHRLQLNKDIDSLVAHKILLGKISDTLITHLSRIGWVLDSVGVHRTALTGLTTSKVNQADTITWLPTWEDILALHYQKPSDTTNSRGYSDYRYLKNADSTTLKTSVLSQVLKNADSTTLKNALLKNIDSTTVKNGIAITYAARADTITWLPTWADINAKGYSTSGGDIEGVGVTAPITGGGTSGTVTLGWDSTALNYAKAQTALKAPLASPTFTGTINSDSIHTTLGLTVASSITSAGMAVGRYSSGVGVPSGGNDGDIYWDTAGLFEYRRLGGYWRQQP